MSAFNDKRFRGKIFAPGLDPVFAVLCSNEQCEHFIIQNCDEPGQLVIDEHGNYRPQSWNWIESWDGEWFRTKEAAEKYAQMLKIIKQTKK